MRYLRRSAFLKLVVLPFALMVWLSACSKWVGVNTAVDAPTALSDPIRVTLNDGEEVNLEDATVTADSVFGRREGTPRPVLGNVQPIRIALNDVAGIEEEKVKAVATLGIVAGILGAVFAVALAASFSRDCFFCE